MKTTTQLTCYSAAALMLIALSSYARDIRSPDSRFAVRAESAIDLVDSSGETILTLVSDTRGDKKVEVQWSPYSNKVIIVETSGRGSDIVAGFLDGGVWHKTIQLDDDQVVMVRAAEREVGSHIVSERRSLGSWVSQEALQVNGEMTFAGGRKRAFRYILEFRPHAPIQMSRAGYEDGALIGKEFVLR